ncbi:hypothetical protein ACTWPT_36975 [Nonomuraea sp. 3N208]|uniref:hypothetical protein n=1 Tax=Nonomuraea sp. 3N208 TaxID=3457421 RepID=UPI003FD4E9AF
MGEPELDGASRSWPGRKMSYQPPLSQEGEMSEIGTAAVPRSATRAMAARMRAERVRRS